MIKLSGRGKNERRIVMLGLSRLNCERLLEGKPIHIFAEELGIETDITIFAGETEDTMHEELKTLGVPLPEPTRPGKRKQ